LSGFKTPAALVCRPFIEHPLGYFPLSRSPISGVEMSAKTQVRWQEPINRPYDSVCQVLLADNKTIFHDATHAAENHANENVADLHTKIAGVDFHREVLIEIKNQSSVDTAAEKQTVIDLQWKAADAAYLFPTMTAQLRLFPIGERAQLEFRGEYEPPMGIVGQTIDAVMGAKIAEASVKHFLNEVVAYLENATPENA
jgi:hypothetical protein